MFNRDMCVRDDSAQGSICVYHMFIRRWLVCSWLSGSSTHKHKQHMQFQATCRVNSMPNPSLAHQATLLHLTSSIFHPVVTFNAHPTQPHYWPPEFQSVLFFRQNCLEFSPKFDASNWLLISYLKWMSVCVFSHVFLYSTDKTAVFLNAFDMGFGSL